nr:putative reverse transcriptase domain-containing protein [Tanacetum cinerariifolium]
MCTYSFTMHHLASCLLFILHVSCMVSYKDDLYKLLLMQVLATPTIHVSTEEHLRDSIDTRMDIIHPEPNTAVAFAAAAVMRTQAQHGKAIRGIQEQLLGVPIQEELIALRFSVNISKARVEIEQQLAAVQESQRQVREKFRKLKELMTSLAGYYLRFIKGFSKIAKSMTKLTQKKVKFDWDDKEEAAFQLIKQKLCRAPILALPEGSKDFTIYSDASIKGLDVMLMQREKIYVELLEGILEGYGYSVGYESLARKAEDAAFVDGVVVVKSCGYIF